MIPIPVYNIIKPYLLLITATVSSLSNATQATWSVNWVYQSHVQLLHVFANIFKPWKKHQAIKPIHLGPKISLPLTLPTPHTLFIEVIVPSMEGGYVYECCPMCGIHFDSAPKILFQLDLGDNCIVFENFMASIGDLMVTNWVYWRRVSGASKRIFATMKSTIDAVKF